jgi:4-hydroxy-3-methylbut-2-enyl diphosphate reductase
LKENSFGQAITLKKLAKERLQVILAQPRGFCAGVVRAIDIVEQALAKYGPPIYVRHEIVHNRHVVDSLISKGARFVEELSEVPDGAITVFSAHGVSRKVVDEASRRGLPTLDATCPLVSKVHNQGRHYIARGRTLILIGHAGHPEVEGTLGQIDGPTYLVQDEAEIEALPLATDTPIAYVTQTTLSVDDTSALIEALKQRFSDVVGPETRDICYATQNRQTAVRDLAQVSDLILVVGAKNSSNSNRLREIAEESGVPGYLVADGSQVDPAWLRNVKVVGLTAGASAPEVLVEDVIDALRRVAPVEVSTLDGIQENVRFRLPIELADEDTKARVHQARERRAMLVKEVEASGNTSQASRSDRQLHRPAASFGAKALSARAHAGAAVPLQSCLRRLRQDRLSRRDSEQAHLGRGRALRGGGMRGAGRLHRRRRTAHPQGSGEDR